MRFLISVTAKSRAERADLTNKGLGVLSRHWRPFDFWPETAQQMRRVIMSRRIVSMQDPRVVFPRFRPPVSSYPFSECRRACPWRTNPFGHYTTPFISKNTIDMTSSHRLPRDPRAIVRDAQKRVVSSPSSFRVFARTHVNRNSFRTGTRLLLVQPTLTSKLSNVDRPNRYRSAQRHSLFINTYRLYSLVRTAGLSPVRQSRYLIAVLWSPPFTVARRTNSTPFPGT